jgi:hypothetical protein
MTQLIVYIKKSQRISNNNKFLRGFEMGDYFLCHILELLGFIYLFNFKFLFLQYWCLNSSLMFDRQVIYCLHHAFSLFFRWGRVFLPGVSLRLHLLPNWDYRHIPPCLATSWIFDTKSHEVMRGWAIREKEFERIKIWGPPRQKVSETPILTNRWTCWNAPVISAMQEA